MSVTFTKGTLSVTKDGETQEIHMLEGGGGGSATESHPLGKVVLFGDSLSSGFANGQNDALPRWTSYLTNAEEVRNFAIGGTTWGTGYSIASGTQTNSCEDMIASHSADIQWADTILLAYGGNDAKSCQGGLTTWDVPVTKAVACVKSIKALNPNARVIYVYLDLLTQMHINPTSTLSISPLLDVLAWTLYCENIEVVRMLYGTYLQPTDMQSDGEHPTAVGIEKIGKQLNKALCEYSTWTPRDKFRIWLGDVATGSLSNSQHYNYDFVMNAIRYGMTPEVITAAGNENIQAFWQLSLYNAEPTMQLISWIVHAKTDNTGKLTRFEAQLRKAGGVALISLATV